jgi:hypothetical protein
MSAHDPRFLQGTIHRDEPTKRELQVAELRRLGITRREIGQRLGISMRSVERDERNLADIRARQRFMPEVTVCSLCSRSMVPLKDHRLRPAEAKALGIKRCRMCGEGATVRCVLGDGDYWVECRRGHLTRAP